MIFIKLVCLEISKMKNELANTISPKGGEMVSNTVLQKHYYQQTIQTAKSRNPGNSNI